jgi:small-conductance mechanosensitive channel
VTVIMAVEVFGESEVSGWDIAVAVAVLVLSVVAARLARRAVSRLASRLQGLSDGARRALARVAFWAVLLVGVGVDLGVLGADIQPLQTATIIAAVVAVIVFRGVAGQYAAGVVLQTRHPFRVGDHVETLGHIGIVKELNSFATVIETYDGRIVHVPNAEVVSNPIVNRTAAGGLQLDFEVRAATADEPAALVGTMTEVAASVSGVVTRPGPIVSLRACEPGRVTALVRAWHDPNIDGPSVAGAIVGALNERLTQLGVDATVVTPPPPPPFTPSPPV